VGNDGKCTPRSFRGTPPLFYRSIFTIRACLKPSSSSLYGLSRRRRVYYEKHIIIIIIWDDDDDDYFNIPPKKWARCKKSHNININLVQRHVRSTIIIYYYRIQATTLYNIIMTNGLLIRLQTAISVPFWTTDGHVIIIYVWRRNEWIILQRATIARPNNIIAGKILSPLKK